MVAETLITPRLILRQPKAADLAAFTAYCGSERAIHVGGPFDQVAAFQRFAAMIGHWALRGFGRYVIERGGVAIGHVGPLALTDDTPDLTWTLWSNTAEGQGYATEAAQACARHLVVDCAWAGLQISIQKDNSASHAVAHRLGAKPSERAAPDWYPGAVIYDIDAGCLT
ncbi:GNAT family N-acetyltransferase [Marivita sp. S0852]|uniref:GNAT family N-acetyltransferase n=1 Tax=Marivita sp. S0852 TaxID=3373893 RepID=UPI003981D7CF